MAGAHHVEEVAGDHDTVAQDDVHELWLCLVHALVEMVDIHVLEFEQDVQVVHGTAGSPINLVAAHEQRNKEIGEDVGANHTSQHPCILPLNFADEKQVAHNTVPHSEQETGEAPDSPGPFRVAIVDESVIEAA